MYWFFADMSQITYIQIIILCRTCFSTTLYLPSKGYQVDAFIADTTIIREGGSIPSHAGEPSVAIRSP